MSAFAIDNEFFVIDTRRLSDVASRFYGYGVTRHGIVEEANYQKLAQYLDGNGCYIDVRVDSGHIKIKQDAIGSYGLYFYRDSRGWTALSNSLMKLVDHLKKDAALSINHDFLCHLVTCELCSHSYSETAINEISELDKDCVVDIDVESGVIQFDRVHRVVNEVEVSTRHGLSILDAWYDKWTAIITNLCRATSDVIVDLSGGFDSRLAFVPVLGSKVALERIDINSYKSELHTHVEDYKIASGIAEKFGAHLNVGELCNEATPFSLDEIIQTLRYLKMGFNKEMYFHIRRFSKRRFHVTGGAGESLRSHWNSDGAIPAYKKINKRIPVGCSARLAERMRLSAERVLERAEILVANKYHCLPSRHEDMARYFYYESRCRNHFGRSAVEDYLSNNLVLMPLADPLIQQLKSYDSHCSDGNLLPAVIYSRYHKGLIDFKFDSNREINPETIARAVAINKEFPYVGQELEPVTFDLGRERPYQSCCERSANPSQYYEQLVQTTAFRDEIEHEFEGSVYDEADKYRRTVKFHPMSHFYALVGVYYAIEAVSKAKHGKEAWLESLKKFHENETQEESLCPMISKTAQLLSTWRIDCQYDTATIADITQVGKSESITISSPDWLKKEGRDGRIITCTTQRGSAAFKCLGSGKLQLTARGPDIRTLDGKDRIPFYVDYVSLRIQNREMLSERTTIWHNEPKKFFIEVKSGDTLEISVGAVPHVYARADLKEMLLKSSLPFKVTDENIDSMLNDPEVQRFILDTRDDQIAALRRELRSLANSESYRIGMAITWPARKFKRIVDRIKGISGEHGK